MADINVVAHGINPETGEYLSPAERKALFKKQRMGSRINPESFRTGTFSSTKKSGGGGVNESFSSSKPGAGRQSSGLIEQYKAKLSKA